MKNAVEVGIRGPAHFLARHPLGGVKRLSPDLIRLPELLKRTGVVRVAVHDRFDLTDFAVRDLQSQ